jgi:hypothetical protein
MREKYPCSKCGAFVLSEDGESTVFGYTNWTSPDIPIQDTNQNTCLNNPDTFSSSRLNYLNYKDLDGKLLKIKIVDDDGCLMIGGVDVHTKDIYILNTILKE